VEVEAAGHRVVTIHWPQRAIARRFQRRSLGAPHLAMRPRPGRHAPAFAV